MSITSAVHLAEPLPIREAAAAASGPSSITGALARHLGRLAARYRHARLEHQTRVILSSLSEHLQRDIGYTHLGTPGHPFRF